VGVVGVGFLCLSTRLAHPWTGVWPHCHAHELCPLPSFRLQVDEYLETRQPVSFVMGLRQMLLIKSAQDMQLVGTHYNVPLLNALVFYVGIQVCVLMFRHWHMLLAAARGR
jgi:CCR4-Not complex component, Not1